MTIGAAEMQKNFLVAAVSLIFAACFGFGVLMSNVQYFTTWALMIHTIVLIGYAIIHLLMMVSASSDTKRVVYATITQWAFAPALCIALSVAVTVIYLLYDAFGAEIFEQYCRVSTECRDLMIEFIIAHYMPVVSYLIICIMDITSIQTAISRDLQMRWWYYGILLFQTSLLPVSLYSCFFTVDTVYGEGTQTVSLALLVSSSFVASLMWSSILLFKVADQSCTNA